MLAFCHTAVKFTLQRRFWPLMDRLVTSWALEGAIEILEVSALIM